MVFHVTLFGAYSYARLGLGTLVPRDFVSTLVPRDFVSTVPRDFVSTIGEVQLGLHKRKLWYDFSSYVGRTELDI